jgi:hypothetical protein
MAEVLTTLHPTLIPALSDPDVFRIRIDVLGFIQNICLGLLPLLKEINCPPPEIHQREGPGVSPQLRTFDMHPISFH